MSDHLCHVCVCDRDAYKECEGMDKETAEQTYIAFTEECFGSN
jgi:acyl-CoA-binding protein